MAEDQDVEGTLSVGFDGSKLEQGIRQTSDVVKKEGDEIKKEAMSIEKVLNDMSKKTQAQLSGQPVRVRRTRAEISVEAERKRFEEDQRKEDRRLRREARRAANVELEHDAKIRNKLERKLEVEANQERRRFEAQERRERRAREREDAMVTNIRNRSMHAPLGMQAGIHSAVSGPQAAVQRRYLTASGMTMQQAFAFQAQSVRGINQQAANYLVTGRGGMPPILGGRVPGGGGPGGGGPSQSWRNLGRFGSAFASGLGIGVGGFGAMALAQGGRALVEDTQAATAYERQRVAAENLAGSQAKLNELLEAYGEASGGVVDKATTLANVNRLMATGFANSADEVERFVRATRGASISLGKPQDYIIQETQLAISNTSVKRLDQIGLGIEEVNDRIELLRATNKGWTREMAFQDAVLGLMTDKYGALTETAEGQATGIEKLARAWADLRLEMGKSASGPVNDAAGFLANIIGDQAQRNEWFNKYSGNPSAKLGEFATPEEREVFERTQRRSERMDWLSTALPNALEDLTEAILASQGIPYAAPFRGPQFRDPVPSWMTGASGSAGAAAPPAPLSQFSEDAAEIMRTAYDAEQQIIKNAYKQRNDAIAQYEEQRTQVAANFAKMMVREEEDFARQRARALRDYERSIMDVMREAQEREADMQEDLDERISDLREDSEERIADIQEKYNKDREKAEKDHRDRLMKAAGQLDAIAVLEERKRWKEEGKEREDAHREAIDEQRESLEEQIEEAREAHAEQLEDAREADAKRLEDMRIAREQQIADEDEDRAIRKNRAIEDHNDQLAEMQRQHDLTLERIEEEATAEREALADALEKDLAEVGVYIAGYHKKMEERDRLVETWIEGMIARMEREIAQDAINDQRDSATGTYRYDPKRGPIIPQDYGSALAASNVSYGTVTNSKILTIQTGAIQVTAQPGMEIYVAGLVEERIIELMEGY